MSTPQRILVIRLSAMGDVAMCVPVLLAFKRANPQVELVTLSRKRTNYILQQISGITVLEARVLDVHRGIAGIFKLSRELRKHKITAIADLHNVLRSKLLRFFMTGTKKAALDKGRSQKKRLINDPNFFEQLQHTTQRYVDVFRQLGYELDLVDTDVLPKIPLENEITKILGASTVKKIGIAPFAAHAPKSLTEARAAALITEISALPEVQVILFGGGTQEITLLEKLATAATNVISLAGKTTFTAELSVISNLDCMIAMDSGNGHLAAMYGVPVVTIWGNTHPFAGFAPFGQPTENQITVNREQFPLVPTSIFGNREIQGYANATDSFDMQQVIERVKAILG
ncbi:MAG: glycosyltransferase family 9 protein [Nonlabens sp.]|nr:glycosyltransferase family 9 protein [Nonlabens sp.]